MNSETLLLRIIETGTVFYLVASMVTMDGELDTRNYFIMKRDLSSSFLALQRNTPRFLHEMEITVLALMSSVLLDWRPEQLRVIYTPNTPTFEIIEYCVDIHNEPKCVL